MSFVLASFTDNIGDREQIVYETYNGKDTLITTEEVTIVSFNNLTLHKIELTGSDGGWADIYLKEGDLAPISINYFNKDGDITKQLIYKENQIFVKLNGGKDQYTYDTNKKIFYDMNSFFHLMRGYPFTEDEFVFWTFLPEIRRSFLLYAKKIGTDELTVNKEKVFCNKIEMGAAGLIESTFFPQKFYFWVTTEKPVRFVQFEGSNLLGKIQRTKAVKYSKY